MLKHNLVYVITILIHTLDYLREYNYLHEMSKVYGAYNFCSSALYIQNSPLDDSIRKEVLTKFTMDTKTSYEDIMLLAFTQVPELASLLTSELEVFCKGNNLSNSDYSAQNTALNKWQGFHLTKVIKHYM